MPRWPGRVAAPVTLLTPAPVPVSGRPRAADGVPAWLSTTALALGGFGIGTSEFATMGILPLVTGDLGATIPQGGSVVSAYALGVVVGAPLLAVAGARLPRKALLIALLAFFTAGSLLSALAPSLGWLLVARFASGLPHGAFFGVAGIVAASLVPPDRRGRAVARVLLGLTVANIVGVPLATLLGQQLGWRTTYLFVAGIGALSAVGVARLVPRLAALPGAGAARELGALRRAQVWLTLLVGAVGFGGFFAVYSYITPTLVELTGLSEAGVPLALVLFGLGMTVGTEVGGRLADRGVVRTMALGLVGVLVVLVAFALTAHHLVPAMLGIFLLSASGSLTIPALQTRLMDVAGDAQSLAAAGNHASLNVANAVGAFLGGAVLAAGHGYRSPALVGAALAAAGLVVLGASVALERRTAAGCGGGWESNPPGPDTDPHRF